jgi:hypothetical protein
MQQNLTNEEYRVIREALLSLICVGDTIYHIFNGFEHPHVRPCRVTEIHKDEGTMTIDAGNLGWLTVQDYRTIEVYEGIYYIWSATHSRDCVERLEEIKKILSHKNILYEFF